METVCEVGAVPHQQLLVRRDGLHCVEVDAHAILTSSQVLLLLWVGWIHIAHPVALLLVQAVYKMMELSFCINLKEKRKKANDKRGFSDLTWTIGNDYFISHHLYSVLHCGLNTCLWDEQTDKWETPKLATISYKSHMADSVSTPPPILTLSCWICMSSLSHSYTLADAHTPTLVCALRLMKWNGLFWGSSKVRDLFTLTSPFPGTLDITSKASLCDTNVMLLIHILLYHPTPSTRARPLVSTTPISSNVGKIAVFVSR